MRAARVSGCLAVAVALAWAPAALADGAAARADALFREGQALLAKGDLAAACPKLADSYALDPALGTLLNLAYCHQKQGRFFTAWSELAKAEQIAIRTEQQERATFAADHRAEIGAKLPRARLVVTSGARITALRIDGQPYEAALDSDAVVVVPPGTHELAIEMADGKKAVASATFPDAPGSAPTEVRFGGPSPAPSAARLAPPQSHAAEAVEADPGAGRRTLGYVVGGVGLAALGVGTYFGIATFSQKDEAAKGCGDAGCTPQGKREGDLAYDYATLSTIFVVTGALATAAGVYLVLSAPARAASPSSSATTSRAARVTFSLGPAGAGVRGAF